MKKINDDLKKKQIEKVYLLCGEEDYLKRNYKNRIIKSVCGDDTMNYHYYEGKNPDLKEIISYADTMPFFAEHRLIVIENSGWFKTSAGADLVEFLPTSPESTCIVFVESEVDKRNKLYKTVKECGYICEMTTQTESMLMRWVLEQMTREGKKITRNTMELFLGKTGTDMQMISQELEKLLSYTIGREIITDEDVEMICTEQTSIRVFDLIDAMAERNQKKALDLYYDLISNKESPTKLLFLLGRQFNLMLQTKNLSELGHRKDVIAQKLGLQSFIAIKTMRQADNFPMITLKHALQDCVETDEAIKTGRMDESIGLELLLVKYTKRR